MMWYLFDLIWAVINKPPRYTIGLRISGYSLDAGGTRTDIIFKAMNSLVSMDI
jgi:hypothetical protein